MGLKVGIASDHAGADFKEFVAEFLRAQDIEVVDYGVAPGVAQSVDFPDYAAIVAKNILSGTVQSGILICGTGLGMCMTANTFKGIRAALVHSEFTAKMSKAHNNAQIICLGARTLNAHRACDYIDIWLKTAYEGGRHQVRLNKIESVSTTSS